MGTSTIGDPDRRRAHEHRDRRRRAPPAVGGGRADVDVAAVDEHDGAVGGAVRACARARPCPRAGRATAYCIHTWKPPCAPATSGTSCPSASPTTASAAGVGDGAAIGRGRPSPEAAARSRPRRRESWRTVTSRPAPHFKPRAREITGVSGIQIAPPSPIATYLSEPGRALVAGEARGSDDWGPSHDSSHLGASSRKVPLSNPRRIESATERHVRLRAHCPAGLKQSSLPDRCARLAPLPVLRNSPSGAVRAEPLCSSKNRTVAAGGEAALDDA